MTVVAALLYLVALIVLLLTPVDIVRYHTRFWELTGQYLGLGWTAGREQGLDGAVNILLFVPLGFLVHRWWRDDSPPSWVTAGSTVVVLTLLASSMESIQIFLAWRHASVADILSNIFGAAIGATVDAGLARIAPPSR